MPQEAGRVELDTVGLRLARLDYSVRRCAYVGGGIGGLLVLVGLDGIAIVNAPHEFKATLITTIVFSAALLGRSYIEFSSAQHDLEAEKKRSNVVDSDCAESIHKYPNSAHASYVLSIILLMITAALVIVGAWWPE